MNERVHLAIDDLRQNAADVTAAFKTLTVEQLNWKPMKKSWSVAQCLDHLIVTHNLFVPLFEKLSKGEFKATLWQKISPFSGFCGRFLVKGLDPTNMKPMKTTPLAYPSSSKIEADIVDRFVAHQREVIAALEKLPADIDTSMTITSPLMRIVTYSLSDALTFMPMHCKRHYLQAKRVTESEGFPQ